MKKGQTIIGIAAIAATLAIAAVAFAQGGYGRQMRDNGGDMMGSGCGRGNMMGQGREGGRMMGDGPRMRGCSGWQGLSEEDAAKVEKECDNFFDETRELRRLIGDKRSAMRSEMIKDNPNRETLSELQKELSQLNTEFDQKALVHRLEMRKLLPENFKNKNFGRRNGKGRGCCQ